MKRTERHPWLTQRRADRADVGSMSSVGQASAIRDLARDGRGDHEISRITGVHVEQVRQVLAKQADAA